MTSPDAQFLQLNIECLFNTFVPLKTKTVKHGSRSWFTSEIRLLMAERNQAYNRWKRFRLEEHRRVYCSLRNEVVCKIRAGKANLFSNRLNPSMNGRSLWNNLRDLGVGKQKRNFMHNIDGNVLNRSFLSLPTQTALETYETNDSSESSSLDIMEFEFSRVEFVDVVESLMSVKSNAVGIDGVHPVFIRAILPYLLPYLTHLFNTILTSGVFPKLWKIAKIFPVPKGRNSNEFRPISILPFLSKVLERIIQKQINVHLNRFNLLVPNQSGFRPKHSCITALINVVEDIRQALDLDKVTFLVLLDFSKAFDTVDHSILFRKLSRLYNFSPSAVALLSSYLSDRKQAVAINNYLSDFLSIIRGVPQGSIKKFK